jgi:NitT/TauT family transport system permease protein
MTFFPSVRRFSFIVPFLSLLLLLALWQVMAALVRSPLLPAPLVVFEVLSREMQSGVLLRHLGVTLGRLALSFSIAMVLGVLLGVWLGRHPRWDRLFDPWLTTLLNIPALVTIILCYVWFGLVESAAIAAVVINKLPNVAVTLREGTRVLDRDLLEMAQCYRFGRWKTLRHVVWPQLAPFALAAARTGLALIWKIILVVELLGRSDGMGFQLQLYFQMFDVAGILAYTLAFIAVIQSLEAFVLQPLDRHARRWRR